MPPVSASKWEIVRSILFLWQPNFPGDPGLFPGPASPVPAFLGQNHAPFGSPPRRELQPASQRFPRGRNTRPIRPGGFPERSSPLASSRRFFLRSRRHRRRHSIRPPSPRHPCVTATSLHLASLSCASDVDAGVSSGAPPPPPSRSSSAVSVLIRRLVPRSSSRSPPLPPSPSVSKVRAPHLLCCSSFWIR